MANASKYRIGVLASGTGSTFEAVQTAIDGGKLPDTQIAFVICNNGPTNPNAQIWEKARRLGVNIFHVSNKTQEQCTVPVVKGFPVEGTISYEASERMVRLAQEHGVDLFVALGFMKKIIGRVLQEFPLANVHHGPLPETANEHGIGIDEKVMRLGLDNSGPTFHWMDKRVDENGLPMYDLGQHNMRLLIGHKLVPVTDAMRAEWQEYGTAALLEAEDMRVEKEMIPDWIATALSQLQAA